MLITVNKATPTITWSAPASITLPAALSGTQLNATASVPGSFVYSPAAGTVLPVGAGQTLSATFTPTDTTNYTSATASVAITVLPGVPGTPVPADSATGVSRTPTLTWTAAGAMPPAQQLQTIKKSASAVSSLTTNAIVVSQGSSLILSIGGFASGSVVPAIVSVKLDGVTDFTIDRDVEANVRAPSYHLRNTVASLPGVAAGSHTVTVTYAAVVSNVTTFLTEVAGIATVAPRDGPGSSATGTTATPASGVNTPVDLVRLLARVAVRIGCRSAADPVGGQRLDDSGQRQGRKQSQNLGGSVEYITAPGSTSENANWVVTDSTLGWVANAVAYKVAAAVTYDVKLRHGAGAVDRVHGPVAGQLRSRGAHLRHHLLLADHRA